MQRTSFAEMPCPVARALERVGDWWTILILREAFYGSTRFDEFERVLGIAPNMLTRRLKQLCQDGLLVSTRYSDKPPRHEYLLTESGRDFRPVLLALMAWGNKHYAPEGRSMQLVDRDSGADIEPVMVNRVDGKPIEQSRTRYRAGPAASETLRRYLEVVNRRLDATQSEPQQALQ